MIATKQDFEVMSKIADRAMDIFPTLNKTTIIMDLEAVHEDVGLALIEMLTAKVSDFAHDIVGIHNNINRTTGKLENCFSPRYAKCYH